MAVCIFGNVYIDMTRIASPFFVVYEQRENGVAAVLRHGIILPLYNVIDNKHCEPLVTATTASRLYTCIELQ